MRIIRQTILGGIAALSGAAVAPFLVSPLEAQITARPAIRLEKPSRFTIGGGLLMSSPRGELANNIDNGFGGDFYGLFRLDPSGALSLRADIGGLQYGSQTIPTGSVFGGRAGLDRKSTRLNSSHGYISY